MFADTQGCSFAYYNFSRSLSHFLVRPPPREKLCPQTSHLFFFFFNATSRVSRFHACTLQLCISQNALKNPITLEQIGRVSESIYSQLLQRKKWTLLNSISMAQENKHSSSLWRVLKENSWKMNMIKSWLFLLAIKNLLLKQGFQWQQHSFTSNPVVHFGLDVFAFDPQPSIFAAGHPPLTPCSEFVGAHLVSLCGTAVCWWTYHQVTAAFPICFRPACLQLQCSSLTAFVSLLYQLCCGTGNKCISPPQP